MRFSFSFSWEKPRWIAKLFPCKHEVGFWESYHDRYGSSESYMLCRLCGRQASDISRNCKHRENVFGVCDYCKERISRHDCTHWWVNEPDTDEHYCSQCGEWKEANREIRQPL